MKLLSTIRLTYSLKLPIFIIGFLLPLTLKLKAQVVDAAYLYEPWKAMWISVPGANPTGYGIYYFRKRLELTSIPASFPVFVSADNRYKLFVNEKLVSLGPARGDIAHWNYETVDLAPFLTAGRNIISAQVWNEAELRTEGHLSLHTAFILQGATSDAQILNTNETWKCIRDSSYSPIPVRMETYYVAGPGEKINMAAQQKGWETLSFPDENWKASLPLSPGFPKNVKGQYGMISNWLLVPSSLPQMELTPQRLVQVRHAEGITVPASFPAAKTPITVPPHTVATLLLDQTFLTNAYPTLLFSGGKNAAISITYQEALFTKYPEKGNRNEIDGKTMIGRVDSILADGTANQQFTTLNWRTYRYIQLRITTKETPLILEDFYGTFTGYPFDLNAKLETDNPEMKKMLDIGWRTARSCAVETYMDCPYYEQLQYIGDARIQAMVSLYNSGDDRLLRNALNLMDHSRLPEGITASRHPSVLPQYITTFSLWYIAMIHDYMMYGKDIAFVKAKLAGARQVLNYFKGFQQSDGSLKDVPYWTFTDWVYVNGWEGGNAPVGKDGYAALLDLQLLWAYQVAADLEQQIGTKEFALRYKAAAAQLKTTIQKKYWDNTKKLFADRTEKDLFSQHANALAILTGLVPKEQAGAIATQLLTDTSLAPASIYFKYYLHQALTKAGLGNDYMNWLGKWRENIAMGLTTWAETSDVNGTRSDCHAWGASPNIEFFRTVLGIDTDAPGFARVKIEPHLGTIKKIGGEMPHPNGKIKVQYSVANGQLNAAIELPSNTTGRFVWKNKNYVLKEGKNTIVVR
ncbi:MAG: alpha-L-rhamnosidase [Ferruginibacter sp.]|uniref:alpha-L-rhamnosidase-related protein n=1 Tax=Ferruginibacter sp. TaxID=1940288 RepID=UPI0026582C0E|nr:alpha-L-rhamnosidase C-terminal domain-containing protein [Ferruginibacter sp.]MDB5279625.1 alpha-L-rhamnosidase [Ferruginibacter sp.]